jgi:DNA polymerase-4
VVSRLSAESARLDVLHVDMDCFFAAVEVLDDPSLGGKPVIVGGVGPRGVVASCSYEARGFGVHSAMAMSEARRRCPQGVVVAGRHGRYSEVSSRLHEIFHEFTPIVEGIGLDEAFLDVSGSHRLFGSSGEIAQAIREQVLGQLGLDCAVGVGSSKLIAKLASKEAKPRASAEGPLPGPGVVIVHPAEEIAFLHPRPVRDLWGVGPKTAERLQRYGITTIGDLASLELGALERLVGRAAGAQLHALSRARDLRPVERNGAPKSIGHEETFPADRHHQDSLRAEIVRLADSVGHRLQVARLSARTVNLKIRFADFSTVTRSRTLPGPLLGSAEIARVASTLLEGIDVGPGVRLLGVSVSSLEGSDQESARQLSLLDPSHPELQAQTSALAEVEAAMTGIRRRYGRGAVGPAGMVVPGEGIKVKEIGDAPWG